ncbi:CLPT1 protein, partial [Mionectes macconnelli]|nr:CLPT1 protein [Mionectes macconnelli]
QVTSNGSAGGGEGAETQRQHQQPPPNAWQVIKGVLFRIFIIWAISSWFRRAPAPQEPNSSGGTPRAPSRNLFPKDTLMDLYVYISEHEHFTDFNASSALFWQKRDLVYGDWTSGDNADGCYEHYGEVDISQVPRHGGGEKAFRGLPGVFQRLPGPSRGFLELPGLLPLLFQVINKYKRRRFQKTKNLLTGETEADPEMIKRAEDFGPVEVISHWHPNLTINMVDDHTPWVKGSVPPPLDQSADLPGVFLGTGWVMSVTSWEHLGTSWCPLQVALLETNPYLLALTIIVSIVHSVFEFLAFKNDIQFWNSRQSLEGLSVRSVFFGVFQSLVVLLYILDNETNFVVQVSVFIGLLIDLWKITKVMDVRLDRQHKVAGVLPRVTFKDKSTYIES